MQNDKNSGIFQLPNGCWGFRFTLMINGKKSDIKRTKNEFGESLKTKSAAIKAREKAIRKEYSISENKPKPQRMTVAEVYNEYCQTGRYEKAYGTIKKQDSLWRNHISGRF